MVKGEVELPIHPNPIHSSESQIKKEKKTFTQNEVRMILPQNARSQHTLAMSCKMKHAQTKKSCFTWEG